MSWSILVVDDEPMARQLLQLMLRNPKFTIREAGNGQEALQKVAQERPDLIILDVMMPVLDGFATCRALRSEAETAALPVILLSAKTHPSAVQEGLDAGANKYLFKPTTRAELLTNIQEVLEH